MATFKDKRIAESLYLREYFATSRKVYVFRYKGTSITLGDKSFLSLQEAKELRNKTVANIDREGIEYLFDIKLRKGAVRIKELFDYSLSASEERNGALTYKRYSSMTPRLLKHFIDSRSLSDQSVSLYKKHRLAEGVSKTTVDKELKWLNLTIRKGVKAKLLPLSFSFEAELYGVVNFKTRYLDEYEIQSLLSVIEGFSPLDIFVRVGLLQGLRYDEILSLRKSKIDLFNGHYVLDKTKTSKGKPVDDYLHEELREYLSKLYSYYGRIRPELIKVRKSLCSNPYITRVEERRLRQTTRILQVIDSDYLITFNGSRLGSIRKTFKHAVRKAGLDPKEVTPHTLKHTFVSQIYINGGDPVKTLKVSRAMMRVYAHLDQRAILSTLSHMTLEDATEDSLDDDSTDDFTPFKP